MPVKQVDLDALDKLAYDTDTISQEGLVREAIAELRELRELVGMTSAALADVHKMIDDGELVRDISKDHAPDWAIKAFDFVTRLQKIETALAAARKWEEKNG